MKPLFITIGLLLIYLFMGCQKNDVAPSFDLANDKSVVAYYRFDNNPKDDSSFGHDGALFGVYFVEDRHGNPNGALYCDGQSYCIVEDANFVNFAGDFTIALFVKFERQSSTAVLTNYILSKMEGSEGGPTSQYPFALRVLNQDHPTLPLTVCASRSSAGACNNSTLNCDRQNTIGDGEWHHVAVVKDNNIMRLYIDGEQTDDHVIDASTCGQTNNEAPLIIGTLSPDSDASTYWFEGAIDDLCFIAKALNDDEVKSISK